MLKDRRYALIINRDDAHFTKPLKAFLDANPGVFKAIFYTDFFPPQAKKWKYIKTSLSIVSYAYWFKLTFRLFKTWIFSSRLSPKKSRIQNSLTALCKDYHIPCFHVKDVNSNWFESSLKQCNVNTIFSMTSQIYKPTILDNKDFEFYNFHPSLLPNNKGRFPIFWAIVKGDDQGLTCHRINKKIDEGKIIYQRVLALPKKMKVEEIMAHISLEMPHFMGQCMQVLESGNMVFEGNKYTAFYGPIPTKEDILKYRSIIKE